MAFSGMPTATIRAAMIELSLMRLVAAVSPAVEVAIGLPPQANSTPIAAAVTSDGRTEVTTTSY